MTRDPGGPPGPALGARGSSVAGALLLAGLAAVIAGQHEFGLGSSMPAAGVMLAGIGLAAAASWLLRRGAESDTALPPRPLTRWEGCFLIATVAAAGVLRLVALDRLPPGGFFDEAQNVLVAGDLLKGNLAVFIGDYTQMPALFFYLLAGAVELLGRSVETARLVSALIGTATVPLFYLLARRLFPGAPAVAATVLLAGSRWHLNFSRIGFTGILSPLVELLTVLALIRSVDRGRRRDWVLLGVTVAVGLQCYYAFNLFPAVMAVALLALLARPSGDGARRRLGPVARGLGWAVLTAAVLLAPLAAYAVKHPDEFFRRSGTVVIWNPKNNLRLPEALWTNLRDHLLMFNFQGDGNPRHNLEGSPTLTAIEGVLLALGLGYALGRGNRWPQALVLAWIAVMMLPGILTIEAPQAYRTIGAIPAVFLLIAQAVEAVGRLARAAGLRSPSPLVGAPLVALAAAAATSNVVTYFTLQVTDQGAFDAFDAKLVEAAKATGAGPAGYRVWVDPIFYDEPDARLILGDDFHYTRLRIGDHLPSPQIEGAGTPPGDYYLLDGYEKDLVPIFRRVFPQARVRYYIDPFGRLMFLTIAVPWTPGALAVDPALARTGFLGTLYDNVTWTAPAAITRRDPAVFFHFHWDQDALPSSFTADWSAHLRVDHAGDYCFYLLSSSPAAIVIDGAAVVSQERVEDLETLQASTHLAAGDHILVVRYRREGFSSALRVWWQPPDCVRPTVVPLDRVTALAPDEYQRLKPALPVPRLRTDQ